MRPFVPAKLKPLVPLTVAFAVLVGVSFLPPDTAFDDMEQSKRLGVCAPSEMEPLVSRDKAKPGFEIELITEAASRLGWSVSVFQNAGMAKEYNPRNWRITRANCRVIVGGIRDNSWSLSLMELSAPYVRSEWVWAGTADTSWPPQSAGFAPGTVALDRVALGQALIAQGVDVVAMQTPTNLRKALDNGDVPAIITESNVARAAFANSDVVFAPLPEGPQASGLSFGFWKGDTTLRREMDKVLAAMARDGTTSRIAQAYGLADAVIK